jgi:hypothetical protein
MTQNASITDEFHTVDYEIEYQTDNTQGMSSLRTLINNETAVGQYTYEKAVASELLGTQNNYTKVYPISINISEDESANKISIKSVYQTGATNLTQGYLDYKIDMSRDEIKESTNYTINGEYITYGNIESKKKAIKTFKDTYYDNGYPNNIETYLFNKVKDSKLFEVWGSPACPNCDENKWNNDANYPNEFTTEAGCRAYYECADRALNPYPKTIKWSENANKATISVTAEFADEDYLNHLVNPKWSVSVNSSKPVYKEMPSANIDGVFVVQDLNCLTSTNTKIATNGEARHTWPNQCTHKAAGSTPACATTPDYAAQEELTNLIGVVGELAVPSDKTKYPNLPQGVYNENMAPSDFNKSLVDNNEDATFPYTFSLSQAYLHTPTVQNWASLKEVDRLGGDFFHINTRDKGYKFGY